MRRLGDDVSSIAIDLPAHGESAGPACDLQDAAGRVNALVGSLDLGDPIVVGHSVSTGIAIWDELLRTQTDQMQAHIEEEITKIHAPVMTVIGKHISAAERDHFHQLLPTATLIEWPQSGHFAHLAEPQRFTNLLREFVAISRSEPASARRR